MKSFFEGHGASFVSISCKVKRAGKCQKVRQMRKCYLSKKSFTYEIYAGTSKAAHKVFQQKGVSAVREFSLFHDLQFFA